MRAALLAVALATLGGAGTAAAADAASAEEARAEFLGRRLDEGRGGARAWQYGWTAADLGGIAIGSAQIALAGDRGELASGIVDTAKSTLALVDLWRKPAPGLNGADPFRALGADPETRVAEAERRLREAVRRRDVSYTWAGHAKVLTTNLVGGAIVASLGNPGGAARSTLAGLLFGELQIWSEPWRAREDLAEYERRFGPRLEVRPLPVNAGAGLVLALRF